MTDPRFSLPRSTMPARRNEQVMHYVRPSSMAHDRWDAGADWATPTSLSFEHEELRADRRGVRLAVSSDAEIPPDVLVWKIEDLYRDLSRELRESGRVVDASESAGVRLGGDGSGRGVVMQVQVKTWPAVPGVTISPSHRPEAAQRW